MEAIQLPIQPVVDLGPLDRLIAKLEALQAGGFNIPVNIVGNLEGLQKQMSSTLSNIQAPAGMAAGLEEAGAFTNSLVTKLKGLGEIDAARKLETGFKSAGAEVSHLNRLYDEMTVKMRSAARNPQNLITGKMNDWEGVLNLISLRTEQIAKSSREAMDAPRDRALFDKAGSSRSGAARGGDEFAASEQGIAAAAKRSQSELAAQEAVLQRKATTFEKARSAATNFEKSEAGVAAASAKSSVASKESAAKENALIRERLRNAKVIEQTFAESAGTTRRVPAGKNAPVFTNVDRLREAQAAVRDVTAEARSHIAAMKAEGATAREINAVYGRYSEQLSRLSIKYKDLDQAGVTSIGRQATALRQLGQRGIDSESRETARREQTAADALQRQRSRALIAEEKERQRLANKPATTSGGGAKGPLGDITGTVKNAATFIAVYRALDLVIQGLEYGIKASVEFERRVATLSIIFRGTKEEARELAIESMRVAAAFGQDGLEAIQVATDFARFGLTQVQTLEAVRVVSMAANVAQIDLAESSKYFQAIMAGYSLDAGQLASVLGSLNTISNTYNVTTKSLLDGLARVAPLARQAGIGLNELAGFEAVITGRTSRPGSEAGQALKALIVRFSKPQTQTALQDVGVNVHDQTGELKQATQVINEMFVAYQNLTRAEQQELLVKVAGTQQAARIAALLDGYITSQELAIRASRDLTSSDRENAAVRATLSSQLGTLKTQWQEFWAAGAGAANASGTQSQLTDVVKSLGNMLSLITRLQNAGSGQNGATSFLNKIEQIPAAEQLFPGMARLFPVARNFNRQMEMFKNLFPKSAAETGLEQLQKFNAELEKLQKLGESDEAASRLFKTIQSLLKSASPEKLEAMLTTAARVARPGDLSGQEDLRAELADMAKQGDMLGLNARLTQLGTQAQASRNRELKEAGDLIDREIGKQTIVLNNLQKQRSAAARGDRKGEVDSLDRQIEQKQNELTNLRARAAGTYKDLFPEGEDQYKSEPIDIDKIKSAVAPLAKQLAASRSTTKGDELDKDILAARLTFELEKRKIDILLERGRVSKQIAADAIGDLQKQRDAEIENIEFGRQFAEILDRQAQARREAGQAAKSFRSGRNEAEDIARERAGLTGPARREDVTGVALNIAAARQEALLNLDKYETRLTEIEEEAFQRWKKRFAPNDSGYDYDFRGAFKAGLTPGPDQHWSDQFKKPNHPTFSDESMYAKDRPDLAGHWKGDQFIAKAGAAETKAAALARLQEYGNRLEELGVEAMGRKLTLEAEITKEREKQSLETSKNLLMADRETQLRAALAQKLIQSRGGKSFTAGEFGFFDPKDKQAISQGATNLLPPEMQSRLADLTREYATARGELASYNTTIASGRKLQEEATKALADLLQKVAPKAGPDAPGNADPTKLTGFDTLSRTMDNGTTLINGTLDRLSQMIEGRDRAFAGALSTLADQVGRFQRGNLQSAIGKAQGAAQS